MPSGREYWGERVHADHPEQLAAAVARRLTALGVAKDEIVSVEFVPVAGYAYIVYVDRQEYRRKRAELAAQREAERSGDEGLDARGVIGGPAQLGAARLSSRPLD